MIMQGCVIFCGTVVFFQNHATFHDYCSLITISTVLAAILDDFGWGDLQVMKKSGNYKIEICYN